MSLIAQMQAQAAAAADAEADYAMAVSVVGKEAADACLTWAQSTIVRNAAAFSICWRAGGPKNAETSPSYRDELSDQMRRLYGHTILGPIY